MTRARSPSPPEVANHGVGVEVVVSMGRKLGIVIGAVVVVMLVVAVVVVRGEGEGCS